MYLCIGGRSPACLPSVCMSRLIVLFAIGITCRAAKLFPVWRLQAAAMRRCDAWVRMCWGLGNSGQEEPTSNNFKNRHGSPAGLEAFLGSKREAAAARRGKLPLVGEVDDMGWEGVEAAATAGVEHYDEVEEDW